MTGPLLYRPAPRWQVISAFAGAIALHLAAVGIAAIRPTEKVMDLSDIPEATVEMSLETTQERSATGISLRSATLQDHGQRRLCDDGRSLKRVRDQRGNGPKHGQSDPG